MSMLSSSLLVDDAGAMNVSSGHQITDDRTAALLAEERHLTGLAYRLLGSLTDAEDVVQETYLRWYGLSDRQRAEIESPGAWLTTVASRICLDLLRSARARRERYVGEWLPEPIPGGTRWINGRDPHLSISPDPADRVTLDESITMAFLVILESMTPAERVAFVLHDVFGYPFADVATVLDRAPGACRQLASSARRRVRLSRRAVGSAPPPGLLREFKRAWEAKDIAGLVELLDPEATSFADSGGLASVVSHVIEGAGEIARGLVEVFERNPGLHLREGTVNDRPGLHAELGGVTVAVLAFESQGPRISTIWSIRNPEKLHPWTTGRTQAPQASDVHRLTT